MTPTKSHPDPGPRALRNPRPDPRPGAQYPQPGLSCPSVPETGCPPPGAPWAGQTVSSRKGSAVSASSTFPGTLPLAKKKTETIKQNPGPCSRIPNRLRPKLSELPNTLSKCQSWGQALPDAGSLLSAGAPGQGGHQAASSLPVVAAGPSRPPSHQERQGGAVRGTERTRT